METPDNCKGKFTAHGSLQTNSFNLKRVPGDCHLDEIQPSVSLVLEKDVWTTGHNFLVCGDGDVPEDLCVLVFMYR